MIWRIGSVWTRVFVVLDKWSMGAVGETDQWRTTLCCLAPGPGARAWTTCPGTWDHVIFCQQTGTASPVYLFASRRERLHRGSTCLLPGFAQVCTLITPRRRGAAVRRRPQLLRPSHVPTLNGTGSFTLRLTSRASARPPICPYLDAPRLPSGAGTFCRPVVTSTLFL